MKVFFSENYISKYNNVLTKNECNDYINLFENSPNIQKRPSSFGNYVGLSLSFGNDLRLFNVLQEGLEKYKKSHKFLNSISYTWGIQKDFNLQKYFPGNAYNKEHMEHGPNDYDRIRILAWMIYLNDVKDGGGTYWPQQNYKCKAKRGSLLIWPAGWTHSHCGIVSKTETKYILTGWCCLLP